MERMVRVGTDVTEMIRQMIARLIDEQDPNGTWNYPFETGISTDAYMIILLRTLEINDEQLIQELCERILSKQEENGAWKLFHDEGNGNLTLTVEAYYALLYSGYYSAKDKPLAVAKRFILRNGGMEKSHMLTKTMLALTGQYPWPAYFPLPIEFILLPTSCPINFFDLSIFGRANLAPLMILTTNKFSIRTNKSPTLSDLKVDRQLDWNDEWMMSHESRSFFSWLHSEIKSLIGYPTQLRQQAIKKAKQYILNRMEPDGTLNSYFSSTFYMIFALLSTGYPKDHPIILRAVKGLKAMQCKIDGKTHIQYTTATVWNTSLISYVLQEAGLTDANSAIQKANRYLLSRQHHLYGDWVIHNQEGYPGGWGFSDINTMHPDVDDTTASLRALHPLVKSDPNTHQAWDRGIRWLISMQNHDGGWPAFEKAVDKKLYHYIPIEGAEYLIADPSTPDLTGRTIEFFGTHTRLDKNSIVMERGIHWLRKHQEQNGSWYGRWGICYIYGTWAAVTGLMSAGIQASDPMIKKAEKWLNTIQNKDGGWGESCKSDKHKTYIALGASTLTHTAWALDALIALSEATTPEIEKGIQFLKEAYHREDWTRKYPAGQGMADFFYIHYHSYQYIFPLLTLTHYKKKFESSVSVHHLISEKHK
jgi:sporulenol synthase